MDKDNLPKLKTQGFVNVTERKAEAAWKKRAAAIAKKFRISRTKSQPDSAEKTQKHQDPDIRYKRLLIKTGTCAVIAIIILAISTINSPGADSVTKAIKTAVNHEFDIEEDIGRLKFVNNLDEELKNVFSPTPEAAVVYPSGGEVITCYGEGGSMGVRIAPAETQIVSIAKGTVTSVGEIEGSGYVKVELDAGQTATFYNITPVVRVDDIVLPAQPIGEVSGEYLYLEMKDGEEFIDPIDYIKKRTAMVLQ